MRRADVLPSRRNPRSGLRWLFTTRSTALRTSWRKAMLSVVVGESRAFRISLRLRKRSPGSLVMRLKRS
nr:MAG TPA: hypothetical protein [Caudoviricetes sp.]